MGSVKGRGRAVCESLTGSEVPFLVVESNHEKVRALSERDVPVVDGDASTDECLERAGIARAKGLVAALGGDAENVYLVLSARQLNHDLMIVSWSSSVEAEIKVRRAGANHVLSPYVLGGRRIASLLTTPHALEFFDNALLGKNNEIRLGEIEIKEASSLVGNSLKGLGMGREMGVIMIGIRRKNGQMIFNPPADTEIHEQDVLIGIGSEQAFKDFRKLVGG